MQLLKEDKTLKASQRERGAGLGKRTEQKEEITGWRAEIRGRVRQGQGRRPDWIFQSGVYPGLCLSLSCLSLRIYLKREEGGHLCSIFVLYLKFNFDTRSLCLKTQSHFLVNLNSHLFKTVRPRTRDPLASCPLHAPLLPFPANLENLALVTEL